MSKFKKGQRVRIYNNNQKGEEFFEGWATIVEDGPDYTNERKVKFDNGDVVYRFINPRRQGIGK